MSKVIDRQASPRVSSPLVFKVTAAGLPEPVIPLLANNLLEPVNVPASGLVVQVRADASIAINDFITVQFDDFFTPPQRVDRIGTLTFIIPQRTVDERMGRAVSASYTVDRTGVPGRKSEVLNFNIAELLIEDFDSNREAYPVIAPLACRISTITRATSIRLAPIQIPFPPHGTGSALYGGGDHSETSELTFNRPVSAFKLACSGTVRIQALDERDNVLHSYDHPRDPHWHSVSLGQPIIKKLRFVALRTGDIAFFYIDNINITY